ncbi:hypothetical protein PC9H_005951 [Pleurotus ostreatus]|uniref:F-box domain-containing protein n=2 Tax=Pleurotus ostreatus TaxID=5322 RepID=A0A067N2C6_PLEO1|nr:uncharacterized protein PC9H_005951 [Pleurotus ostreatus]KAF7430249.1 hypothetical protein PC9H_005951 [Pleurotus ostreatus]KAJ8701336.1 hypothetical protein PTI98_000137 [Pleurotus ostreatus]KDQ22173.1 hypothetical protein PLEOSDRAFT_163080 [Pleurotus ostreatus PC15]
MDHHALPNELWIHIFDFVETPGDLARLILACRRFRALAHRPLYRTIQWLEPFHTAANLQEWMSASLTDMTDVPRTLIVSHHNGFAEDDIVHQHHTTGHHSAEEEPPFLFQVFPQPPPNHTLLHASVEDLHERAPGAHPFCVSSVLMGPRISSFTHLNQLTFFDTTLPESVYRAIFNLPNLRHLCIEYCTLPSLAYTDEVLVAFSNLPIVHLSLQCFSFMFNRQQPMDFLTPYFLCTAASIQTLKIDWTRKAASFFSYSDALGATNYVLAQNVKDVEIRLPHEHLWPKQDNIARRLYTDALAIFLGNSPTIESLSFTHKLHAFHLPTTALPNLTSFSGPMNAAVLLLNRPLRRLNITDVLRYHQPFITCMEVISTRQPELQSLGFLLPAWEDEVLYVISSKFAHLRELAVMYVVNNPSEQTLLSMCHHFLHKFPLLDTVRVFKPVLLREINQHIGQTRNLDREIYTIHDDNLGPGSGSDDDVREFILTWKRVCPLLKEVQYEHKSIWTSCTDGSGWVRTPTKHVLTKVTEAMELKWGMSS